MWQSVYEVFWLSAAIFFVGYLLYCWKRNAGILDLAYCTAIMSTSIYLQIKSTLFDTTHLIHTLLMTVWGIRILHLNINRMIYIPEEDSRYVTLRQMLGDIFEPIYFVFWPL